MGKGLGEGVRIIYGVRVVCGVIRYFPCYFTWQERANKIHIIQLHAVITSRARIGGRVQEEHLLVVGDLELSIERVGDGKRLIGLLEGYGELEGGGLVRGAGLR